MLQRLIHSARANVFENARFYYWVLVILTSYFLLNRFLQKLSFVYLDNRWIELKVGEGILFGLAYVVILISAWFLRKKIPRYVFWCWGGLLFIFLINEFQFAWGNADYSLIESLTKSQGYYTAKFTMPLLFWGVWSVLEKANHYGVGFITQLQRFLTINAVLIIAGTVFDISLFESYPLSGRWGYSGLLWHYSFHNIIYGVFLLYLIEQKKKPLFSIILFGLVLLLLGQKAGLLYFLLIFTLGVVTSRYLQGGVIASSLALIFSSKLWLPHIITFSPFWEVAYNKHGVWGVLLSLRNEHVERIWNNVSEDLSIIDVIFGGVARFKTRVEMMPFDILIYFGFTGLFFYYMMFFKIIPNFKWGIPIIVSFIAGGIYEVPFGMLIYFILLQLANPPLNPGRH